MTTSRIKEKISALVSSQFPEFVQSDFPTFVAFIEAYYRFLEQDQGASELIQNARSYNDIDRTTDSFVDYFLNTYTKDIPKSLLSDKKFLVKKIKDLYESKGSELSFKLLFKILFDTKVEIEVPYENVLRASGGQWQQGFSIIVETITGNRNNLLNRSIRHSAGGVIFSTPIVKTKNFSNSLTEIFLDPNFLSSSYSIGDLVEVYQESTLLFSGNISPTTVSLRIDQPGTGFKVGQIFNITAGGSDTLLKITEVSSTGGIVNAKIISYGYGYSGTSGNNTITVILDKDSNITQRQNFYITKLGGYGSSGLVLKSNPSSPDRYFDADYVIDPFYTIPEIAASFNNDSFVAPEDGQTTGTITTNLAVLVFTLGGLTKYPGSYYSEQSFVSEFVVRIQDDELYQPFAYQTNTDIDLSVFVEVIKKLLNPAGQILFNNRILEQNINLSSDLQVNFDRNIFVNLHDSIKYFDSDFNEVNTFNDSASVIDQSEFYNMSKTIEDTLGVVDDTGIVDVEKQISDNISIDDNQIVGFLVFRTFEEDRFKDYFLQEYTDTGDYAEQSGMLMTDETVINESKPLSDLPETNDQISLIEVFVQDYFSEEYISASENSYVLTKTNTIVNP